MVAAYGGLTVVLAVRHPPRVARRRSRPSGATLATVGVILTGVAFDGGWRGTRFASPGVIFAIVALVLFATMSIGTDIVIDRAPWEQVLLVSRTTNAILSSLILVVAVTVARRWAEPMLSRRSGREPRWPARGSSGSIVLAGILDVLGLLSFSYGLQHAETWLVGLASSFGPAVTIVVAVAFLGERLKPIQWVGLAGVLAGMIAIGLP